MFPLNDTERNRYSNFPYMTVLLILVNTAILGWELVVAQNDLSSYRQMIYQWGTVPARIISQEGSAAVSAITAAFLHGDVWHLGSNMLALWVFGRRVEDACGSWRFLVFYLTAGAISHIVSAFVHYNSSIPSIGASGAIFGVMGAYLLLFPGGRIRTVVLLWFVPLFPRLRAIWVILYFLALQFPPAMHILLQDTDYQIGYWAHLGGFFSAALILLFIRPEAYQRFVNNVPV